MNSGLHILYHKRFCLSTCQTLYIVDFFEIIAITPQYIDLPLLQKICPEIKKRHFSSIFDQIRQICELRKINILQKKADTEKPCPHNLIVQIPVISTLPTVPATISANSSISSRVNAERSASLSRILYDLTND